MKNKPPFIRSPYNYDLDEASNEAAYVETAPSLTIQSQAIDTDINEIVRRVGIGAPMPINTRIPTFGDYSEVQDFRSALAAVNEAEEHFMQLPAQVRAQFENDPQRFLDFCTQPGHGDQLRTWGLRTPEEIAPQTPPPAPPGAPQPEKGETKK